MFCYQCEQSSKGNCHTSLGVCGKTENTAAVQDVLLHAAKGLAYFAHKLRLKGIIVKEFDVTVMEALFTTVTNVNFDAENIKKSLKNVCEIAAKAKAKLLEIDPAAADTGNDPLHPANYTFSDKDADIDSLSASISILKRKETRGADIAGVEEMIVYGLKGLAAYADHAYILDFASDDIFAAIHETLAYIIEVHDLNELLGKALDTGKLNYEVMELLDNAHTSTFGHPVPTPVRINPIKGKAILVSGHDLKDLIELLKQTEGMGINIYTHGEMLPAHGYPELKKYSHLAGNYGGAWQDQHKEFAAFPGAILMTTNCIQKPKESYMDNIFTCGLVEWPEVKHIENRDFAPLIEKALALDGFTEDSDDKTILTGFGHNAVLNVAEAVVDAVKTGKIKHFFLVGGCDGAKSGRNYYTEFAAKAPQDTVILTLACGKFRFNKMEFGDIGGIPRLLDIGQCNDAYSAIKIAATLAEVFKTDVNGLPLSMILSWYEQKAVAILLTLLWLGIKNIKIGPTLPAFIEPNVLDILVKGYNLSPIGNAEDDIKECLARTA